LGSDIIFILGAVGAGLNGDFGFVFDMLAKPARTSLF
jgi:hypothetical protein